MIAFLCRLHVIDIEYIVFQIKALLVQYFFSDSRLERKSVVLFVYFFFKFIPFATLNKQTKQLFTPDIFSRNN